jgi:Asp-tRNA(Asn)/Glu-tRNA(Gln) amidotransferase C subunit
MRDLRDMGDLEGKLAETLNYVEILKEIKTEGVVPTYQVGNNENRMRGDVIEPERIIPTGKYEAKIVWE